MDLLGVYRSALADFHYQELVALLQESIQAGEFSAGATFDQSALNALQQQGQDFAALPLPAAGQRATEQTFNYPLSLLTARFSALVQESAAFAGQATQLLALIEKDTALVDQLLAAAALKRWVHQQPQLENSVPLAWDFATGYGPIAPVTPASNGVDPLWTDPRNGVMYLSRPPRVAAVSSAGRASGLGCAADIVVSPVKNLTWSYAGEGDRDILAGEDWTALTVLEPSFAIQFSSAPVVTPTGQPFHITGTSRLGALPVYINTSFTNRRRHLQRTVTNGTAFTLSPYVVSPDDVVVLVGGVLADPNSTYSVDAHSGFLPLQLDGTATVDIYFEEAFPSYQCSLDQIHWSPVRMLDPLAPYPDTETQFDPIALLYDTTGTPTALPITDELGNPTGLSISLGSQAPTDTALLTVASTAAPATVGLTAVLSAEFGKLGYLNGFRLAPFATFPLTLKQVEVEGLTSATRTTVWEGSTEIEVETTLKFPTQVVRRIYLTFYQQNYLFEAPSKTPEDALRRNVMAQLQAVLPFSVRQLSEAVPVKTSGAQYEFGLESLQGETWTAGRSVFVAGPHRYSGSPDVFRFDASVVGEVDFYLAYQAFDASGTLLDINLVGIPITPGSAMVFPLSESLVRNTIDHLALFLKIIHREPDAVVERFLFQMTSVDAQ